ncbi:MAG: tryptophanase [bacterium]
MQFPSEPFKIEAVQRVCERRDAIRGCRITWQTPYLRHFTARFEPR